MEIAGSIVGIIANASKYALTTTQCFANMLTSDSKDWATILSTFT